jgi:RimJ/RimL family protein N-acetyltransferase
VSSPVDRADQYWAAVFEVEQSELRQPGRHVTYVDDPSAGIYVLELDECVRVRAPRHRASDVDALPVGAELDGNAWRAALRGSETAVLGPAAHFLGFEEIEAPHEAAHPSVADVQRLAAGIPAEEREESGVLEPDVDRFGLWENGALVAVSSLSAWVGGRTDVGLLVAAGFRGLGLGREAAAIALNEAIRRSGIARWRCREDNAASMALAAGFRLQPYARNLGIRL